MLNKSITFDEDKYAFEDSMARVHYSLDLIYEEIDCGEFIEVRGITNGKSRAIRVYKNGRIDE